MNYDQFAYWLQGFVEMNNGKEPTKHQWDMITEHLTLCFAKVTKDYSTINSYPDDRQVYDGYGGAGGSSFEQSEITTPLVLESEEKYYIKENRYYSYFPPNNPEYGMRRHGEIIPGKWVSQFWNGTEWITLETRPSGGGSSGQLCYTYSSKLGTPETDAKKL